MQPDYAAAYEETRKRVDELARSLDEDQLARKMPATPDWSAKDLIAHMVGIARDISSGNLDGVGSPPWTEAQVEKGRAQTLEDLLSEWERLAPEISAGLNFLPRTAAGLFVGDLVTHEHDLRGGVGRPGAREANSLGVALDTYAFRFRRRVEKEGLAPVVISDGKNEWRWGEGEPGATVAGEPFELLRSLTGRRTPSEMQERLTWTGNAAAYLPLVPLYGIPETSLGE